MAKRVTQEIAQEKDYGFGRSRGDLSHKVPAELQTMKRVPTSKKDLTRCNST
jgi:hypothetical protein